MRKKKDGNKVRDHGERGTPQAASGIIKAWDKSAPFSGGCLRRHYISGWKKLSRGW